MSEALPFVKHFLSSLRVRMGVDGRRGFETPDARSLDRLVETVEHSLVGSEFVGGGSEHWQLERFDLHAGRMRPATRPCLADHVDYQAFLAARHCEKHFREQFRVEQCAVQRAMRIA